jgi:hypothetical protein
VRPLVGSPVELVIDSADPGDSIGHARLAGGR